MTAVIVGAVLLCATMVFIAAELAPGLNAGRRMSQIMLIAALVIYAVTAALLVQYGPGTGINRTLVILVPGMTAIACFFLVLLHLSKRFPAAAFISATFGIGMLATSGIVLFGNHAGAAGNGGAETLESTSIVAQIDRLGERRRALQERLSTGIPDFRRKLAFDADVVKRELADAGAAAKVRLDDELREIARLLIAVDQEESETRELISRIQQEERRLARLQAAETHLGADDALHDELDAIWREAGVRLAAPLDEQLGTGAVEDLQVEQKISELMGG